MGNFEVRLQGILSYMEEYGVSGFGEDKIEELESIILECNRKMSEKGSNSDFEIADSIYDTLYSMLKDVNPDSDVLNEVWGYYDDEISYTELLDKNPMMSIETAKSWSCQELSNFINRMPEERESYMASYKINGHGIRVVYKDGDLVSATSRARSSKGRDITSHLRVILGKRNEKLADYGLVELRGEICLKIENLDKAREFNPNIKSPFSAVASLIKPSASREEVALLDFLCYGLIIDGFEYSNRDLEFEEISRLGYSTPSYIMFESDRDGLKGNLQNIIEVCEESYEEFGYFCDGVVVEINDRELFRGYGTEGNHTLGNIALKVGVWEQSQYPGYVQKIIWKRGKTKLSPVALVAENPYMVEEDEDGNILNMEELGVLTAQGNRVRNVPLYEPKNILILGAYVGDCIYFRYGGEAGVVPCFADGRLLSEDAVKDMLE